jgi:hypothetical protein
MLQVRGEAHTRIWSVCPQRYPDARVGRAEWLGSGASLRVADEINWYEVENRYIVPDEGKVYAFLRDNPSLSVLLIEAYRVLDWLFGPDPQIELRVVTDPEAEEVEMLFAYIRTTLPVKRGLAKLHEFDRTWFLNKLGRTKGRLNFSLSFL